MLRSGPPSIVSVPTSGAQQAYYPHNHPPEYAPLHVPDNPGPGSRHSVSPTRARSPHRGTPAGETSVWTDVAQTHCRKQTSFSNEIEIYFHNTTPISHMRACRRRLVGGLCAACVAATGARVAHALGPGSRRSKYCSHTVSRGVCAHCNRRLRPHRHGGACRRHELM
jgi:hypothetical protein